MVVCDWVLCPQTRLFSYKTRKGEKITFSVGIEICLDSVKSVLVSKDITAKISVGTLFEGRCKKRIKLIKLRWL
jgi:hypothetical protein